MKFGNFFCVEDIIISVDAVVDLSMMGEYERGYQNGM